MKPLALTPSGMRRSGIRELMALAEHVDGAIHLEIGEPDAGTPGPVIDAAHRGARAGRTGYTPTAGYASLRAAVAQRLHEAYGLPVDPAGVIVTPGAVGALVAACFALLDPGDEVLVPDPGWPNYTTIPMLVGAVPVPYVMARRDGYIPDPDALDGLVTRRTKAIVVNSPGNPTGAVFPPETVAAIVAFADRHDLYVISDEVYESFVFTGVHTPAARFDRDGRVVGVSGWSKTYAMTGWRLGYAYGSPAVVDVMGRVQEKLVSCPSSVSQVAGEAALALDPGGIDAMRDTYRTRRDLAVSLLGPRVAAVPVGAFYLLVDTTGAGPDSFTVAKELLAAEGVVTAPGATFGASSDDCLRISLAAATDAVDEGCRRIARFLQERAT